MANHIEFRKARYLLQGSVGSEPSEHEVLEYRSKDILIDILGVTLGTWSDWKPIEEVTVTINQDSNI